MVVQVRLFGALKKYSTDGLVMLDVPEICQVGQVRDSLKTKLAHEFPDSFQGEVVDRSAIAVEGRILRDEEHLKSADALALLPPVCGG